MKVEMPSRRLEGCGRDLRGAIPASEVLRVMEWYDSIAPSYDGLYVNEQHGKYSIISQVIGSEYKKILDVGCGSAEFLLFSCKKNQSKVLYIGIDISFNLLTIAREKALSLTDVCGSIAEFIAGDLSVPPLREDARFDLIILVSVLRSTYDVEAIVDYFTQRHLDEGGAIVLTVMYESDCNVREGSLCPKNARLIGIVHRNEVACIVSKSEQECRTR
ncbi:MAG: class I SAM-dependent methyltransferase [Desulfurococcales archaeon]|nr:class I SAM-dependent methyltransferase [Desulfurococcales archaeon]